MRHPRRAFMVEAAISFAPDFGIGAKPTLALGVLAGRPRCMQRSPKRETVGVLIGARSAWQVTGVAATAGAGAENNAEIPKK